MPRPQQKRGFKYFFLLGKIEVDYETGCWIWLGAQDPTDGYGKIHQFKNGRWRTVRAQRYFFELYRHELPTEIDVGHNCHRRLCVRLRHLIPISHGDNMRLMHEGFLGEGEKAQLRQLLQTGLTISQIADKMMAPRPLIMKAVKTINWRSFELLD